MFQAVICTPELIEKLGSENYDFTTSVRFEVEGRLPPELVKFEVYSYCPETEKTTYYYGYRRQGVMPNDIIACFQGQFDGEDFLEGFKLFSSAVRLFEEGEKFQIIMDEVFSEPILPYFKEIGWDYVVYPSMTYYMTKRQEELLMNEAPIEIPEGYELGISTLDDAEVITNCYMWKKPRELDMTRMKLSAFPTSCLRHAGSPVGFQMIHPSGMLNQLFVMEEHRGKGLGYIVEQDLCRKLIRENWVVFKTVLRSNPSVLKGTDKSPYWTRKEKEDGSPMLKMYMDVWKKDIKESYQ